MEIPFKFVLPDYPLMVHSVDWKSDAGFQLKVTWAKGWEEFISEKYGPPDFMWTDVSPELAKRYLDSGQWAKPADPMTTKLAYFEVCIEAVEENLHSLKVEFAKLKNDILVQA